MREGLVSIITPTYNCGRFIGRTIDSVLQQTYENWEMIIVDDRSTDDTREVVEEYMAKDSRIKYTLLDENSGAAVARTRAMSLAEGEYMAFLDSDDIWHPEKTERQLEFMIKNNYHFSYTNYCEIDENSNEKGILMTGPRCIDKKKMIAYCWPGCLTIMYDAEYIGLMQTVDIKINEEYALWIKIAKKANCHLLDEDLARYRKRDNSLSSISYLELIKWHYKMFRQSEKKNVVSSLILTSGNLVFGTYKKIAFRKRY